LESYTRSEGRKFFKFVLPISSLTDLSLTNTSSREDSMLCEDAPVFSNDASSDAVTSSPDNLDAGMALTPVISCPKLVASVSTLSIHTSPVPIGNSFFNC